MDFLEDEFEEILDVFRAESEEHIQNINQNLLKLEANPNDNEAISVLFREAHSLKGAARMIGLNDIQSLAHKIEDVFGLAKDRSLEINAEIIDILCKSIDCINSIIEESIQTKGKSHSVNIDRTIEQLEKIKGQAKTSSQIGSKEKKSQPSQPERISFNENNCSFSSDISCLIPQIDSAFEKLSKSSMDGDLINKLYDLVVSADNLVQTTNNFEIKEPIGEIKIKLDGVVKGSGILLNTEVEELWEIFNIFIQNLKRANIYKETDSKANLEKPEPKSVSVIINEDELKKEIQAKNFPAEKISQKNDTNVVLDNNSLEAEMNYISQNIISLSNEEEIDPVINKLEKIINNPSIDEGAKKILEKILEISLFSKETGTKPNAEITDVIKQSFDTAQLIIFTSSSSVAEDPDLIVQRLAILQQMIKLSSSNIQEQDTTGQDEEGSSAGETFSQKTELIPNKPDQTTKNPIPEGDKTSATIKTLRVDTKKLDQLVGQVGELIIAKIKVKEHLTEVEKISRSIEDWNREWHKAKKLIKHSAKTQNKNAYTFFEESSGRIVNFMNQMNALYKIIQEDDTRLSLIVNELEEKIKSVRVLPLATIFHMFPRMVRDIAREKGKDIELVISGSETSVDKKIIEEIKSPLTHIIRNAIDHGIEDPETRKKNGKNPTGKILLSAYHLENSVLIEVTDDGKGIDVEVIKRKVLQKGLLTQAELQAMSDEQITNIIFWSGFSTSDVVTDISGRGVGLDAVYTKISQLEGKVNIKSTVGEGCKVSIQLPVTMATIKAFLVSVNKQTFAIPTSAIKTTMLIKHKDIFYKEGRETIIVNNKTVPICRLSKILNIQDQKLNDEKIIVIIIESDDLQVGFVVDKLIGDQEILHKNLTPPLLRVRNVAGVTTLASGELCLILNVSDLVKSAYSSFGMSRKDILIKKEENPDPVNKKNILVVDDSVTTRILERNILRAAGYSVTIAINGLDALTKILSEKFDLIVSDVEMPEINGFELTERIKNDDQYKHIPIILVTSLASEADKKKGLNLGASAYITKGGFDQNELLSAIQKAFNS